MIVPALSAFTLALIPFCAAVSYVMIKVPGGVKWIGYATEADGGDLLNRTMYHVMIYYGFISALGIGTYFFQHFLPSSITSRRINFKILDRNISITCGYFTFWMTIAIFQSWSSQYWLLSHKVYVGSSNLSWKAFYHMFGGLSAIQLGLTFIPQSRHTAVTHFFNINYNDEAMHFHKYSGALTLLLGLVHFFAYLAFEFANGITDKSRNKVLTRLFAMNPAPPITIHDYMGVLGVVGLLLMTLSAMASVNFIRRRWYSIFLIFHYLMVPATVFLYLHATLVFYYVMPGFLLYLLEFIFRISSTVALNINSLSIESNGYIKLCLENYPYDFTPSQYVNLTLPTLNPLISHPFTIASSPSSTSKELTLLIKPSFNTKSWTQNLKASMEQITSARISYPQGKKMSVPSRVIILVAGSGVTGGLSIAADAISQNVASKYVDESSESTLAIKNSDEKEQKKPEHGGTSKIKPVKFIWFTRDEQAEDLSVYRDLINMPGSNEYLNSTVIKTSGTAGKRKVNVYDMFIDSMKEQTGNEKLLVYVCGPDSFVSDVKLAENAIHSSESFAANRNISIVYEGYVR